MVGYGEEHSHFVMELTYNYGVKNYKLGNDFQVHSLSITNQNQHYILYYCLIIINNFY